MPHGSLSPHTLPGAAARYTDAALLALPFADFLAAFASEIEADPGFREVLFCAYYGKHSQGYHARRATKAREAKRAARAAFAAKIAAKVAARRDRIAREGRRPVRWNDRNRARAMSTPGLAARCAAYYLKIFRLGGKLRPLSYPVGTPGHKNGAERPTNGVQAAIKSCNGGKAACAAVERAVRRVVEAQLLAVAGLKFCQQDGIFFKGFKMLSPLHASSPTSKEVNDYIPAGAGIEERRTVKRREPLQRKLWHLARQGAAVVQKAWSDAAGDNGEAHAMPYRPSYAVRWFHRGLQYGFDLRDMVGVHTGERGVKLLREWCAKAAGAGATGRDAWTPGGFYRALSGVLGEVAAPFWADKGRGAAARRHASRREGEGFRAGLRAEALAAARARIGINDLLNRVFA